MRYTSLRPRAAAGEMKVEGVRGGIIAGSAMSTPVTVQRLAVSLGFPVGCDTEIICNVSTFTHA